MIVRQHIPHQEAKYTGVLNAILSTLYKTDYDRLLVERGNLLSEQIKLCGDWALGFMHTGIVYSCNDMNIKHEDKKYIHIPHPDIANRVDAHVRQVQAMNQEKLSLRQSLIVALRRCNDNQDIRDMLPDCATKNLTDYPELCYLPRTRPVGFLFAGSPTLSTQYQKAVERMEMLSIVQLFY